MSSDLTLVKLNFLLNSFNKTEDEHRKNITQHLGDLASNILDKDKSWESGMFSGLRKGKTTIRIAIIQQLSTSVTKYYQ